MKKCIFPFTVLFVITGIASIFSQNADITIDIGNALKAGNAYTLAKYFNSSLELVLPDKDEVYSKEQATTVINDFFSKNKPLGFAVQHKGGPDDARFIVGTLTANSGKFRVYYLLKKQSDKQFINLLRIEKEIE
jgi:hypothetical protein